MLQTSMEKGLIAFNMPPIKFPNRQKGRQHLQIVSNEDKATTLVNICTNHDRESDQAIVFANYWSIFTAKTVAWHVSSSSNSLHQLRSLSTQHWQCQGPYPRPAVRVFRSFEPRLSHHCPFSSAKLVDPRLHAELVKHPYSSPGKR